MIKLTYSYGKVVKNKSNESWFGRKISREKGD